MISKIVPTDPVVSTPSVRLVDGTDQSEGRVEIWHDNEWGTICNTAWSIQDAHVVCRELGFADAVEVCTFTTCYLKLLVPMVQIFSAQKKIIMS